jgi:hypothetical protein
MSRTYTCAFTNGSDAQHVCPTTHIVLLNLTTSTSKRHKQETRLSTELDHAGGKEGQRASVTPVHNVTVTLLSARDTPHA